MKIISFFILQILLLSSSFALSLDERRKKIISIIDEELSEVSRLSKQTRGRNPDHLLRMAELYLEKARLWREKENETYINLPDHVRRKTNKRRYFSKSTRYFKAANQLCIKITRKFKNYHGLSDVYYILGYNAKESGKTRTAQKYFYRANKKSRGSSITKIKSQISLAEIHYNNKRYNKAIPLYERALARHKDKWWTKDSFNLAWCYFRTNRYSKAINKMKEVFQKSSSSSYVDMRSQVERDIGLFFATAGRINEGIGFYKKIGINFTDQLLRIAVTMKSKGQFTRAKKTLDYALKYEKSKKRYAEIYAEQLDLYQKFGRISDHLSTAQKMYKLYRQRLLTDNQLKTLKYQVGKMAAILQKQVASKTYKRMKKKRKAKAYAAIAYFEILGFLEKNKLYEHSFHMGETAFIIDEFDRSLRYYNESFDHAAKVKNSTYMQRSMEGILASLGQRRLSNKVKENYYVPVYEKYLKYYPRGRRAKSIYQKLFRVYFDRNQVKEAKNVLDRFVKNYPNDWKVQEAMVSNLMERNKKRKENGKIRAWITAIDSGKYKVSKKFANRLRQLLTTMQIENVQMDLKKGKKKEALVGYHQILKDKHSTKKSKINAKYNLAALYYEMGATENTYNWSNKALDEMTSKDTLGFVDSFLTISSFLFMRLEFEKSANLSKKIVEKLCKRKTRKKNIAYKNGAYIYLAEGQIDKAEQMIALGYRCKLPRSMIDTIRFELLKDFEKQQLWTKFEQQINVLSKLRSNRTELIKPLHTLQMVHARFGNNNKASKLNKRKWSYYLRAKKRKEDIPLDALDIIAEYRIDDLKKIQSRVLNTTLKFPFSVFQKKAQYIRQWLDKMIVEANKIQDIGSGQGIVKAYELLIDTHKKLANKFLTFKPKKLTASEKQNITSFYKQMKVQSNELINTSKTLMQDVWSTIDQNQILAHANSTVLPNNFGLPIRYWYPDKGVIMDRGGKK